MLKTKCILNSKEKSDGFRISIMSRHTLNDGITPHPEIISGETYEGRLKILAPPDKLIGDYYKRGLPWNEFEKQYLEYIRTPEIAEEVKDLAKDSLEETVTLLCIEESPEFCHRRLLAEECKLYEPSLELYIR